MLDETRTIHAKFTNGGLAHLPVVERANPLVRVLEHQRFVLSCALLGAVLAYGLSLFVTPVFTATVEIFIDPRTIQALDAPSNQNPSDNNAQVSFVESQARIVTSEGVLSRVVASQDLAVDPSFDGEGGLASALFWAQRLGLAGSPPYNDVQRRRFALTALGDRVTVRRPERTFVMDISVKADTAIKAAALANAVAQAYFDEQKAAHAEMAGRAATALTGRLEDLRDRLHQAEGKVQSFKIAHGLVGTRAQLSSEQQLTEANSQLAQAQGRVVQAQARINEAQRLKAAGTEGDAPEAVASPTMAILRGQQAEARRRLNNTLEQYGPRHPTVRDAQAEVDGLQRSIDAELARIGQAARVEFRRATTAVAVQSSAVDRLSRDAQQTSGALLQLGQLEREVDIDKNLLDTFLSRSREVSEIAGLETTDGRVVSAALPPLQRSFPPRGLLVSLLGAVLGLLVGTCLTVKPWLQR